MLGAWAVVVMLVFALLGALAFLVVLAMKNYREIETLHGDR